MSHVRKIYAEIQQVKLRTQALRENEIFNRKAADEIDDIIDLWIVPHLAQLEQEKESCK